MSDPNPAVADPAPAPPPLAEAYPACFDWERPRPLKLDIQRDLMAAGHDRIAVKRALGRYCKADRYRRALQIGAARIDLHGQPAGLVTLEQGAIARQQLKAGKPAATGKPDLPPDATPLPKEHLVPGRLELAAKFSELPWPLPVPGGMKISVPAGEWTVTAILPAKVWRKLEQAAKDYPQWVAALSGSLERIKDGEIALKHPALQIYERKARPETAAEAPEPKAPDRSATSPTRSMPTPKEGGAAKAG